MNAAMLATVSVILPCFNAHAHLGQAIASVRNQTYPSIEIIVVNDGSTDPSTLKALEALPADVRLLHQANQGLPKARNAGIEAASGHFVIPLDCDDWLEPTFVARAVSRVHDEQDVVFSQVQLEGQTRGVRLRHFNYFEQLFANQLPYCMLMPKSLWARVGGYDEAMRQGYEDWEFNIRLAAMGARAIVMDAPLFHYRVSHSGMLQSMSRARHGQLWQYIQAKHAHLYTTRKLWSLWLEWHERDAARPLWRYVPILVGHRFLPDIVFNSLFRLVQSTRDQLARRHGLP
jgi:glycosyltransferase involved in cell wall biosynthesis